ncbi:MAG TPA: MFS transporter [Parvibaculum sp.]|uniref:MFS transporter n=1 Tax=Parvibaculum sp. TaxID=2024848 RepID=UPI002B9920D8|nr:MFS transporter [Parvibaculum sp.]HMM15152.1 MFS transporter [Parvibaculum sp.]
MDGGANHPAVWSQERKAAEEAYHAEVERNLTRNYVANLAHGLLGQTGFRLVTAPTFVPAYIFLLSGSEFVVGLALASQWLGNALSATLGATLVEHRKRVLPMGLLVGWGMRGGVLGLSLSGYFLPDHLALIFACVFLGFFGLFNGIQSVIFQLLMAKVIPLRLRGRLTGFRNFAAGLTAAGVAYIGGKYFVEAHALGNGYATTFLAAFVLTSAGLSMLLMVREPDSPEVRPRTSLALRLREIPGLLREDRELLFFCVASSAAALGTLAVPFYILFAGETIGLSGTTLGALSTAFLLAQTGMNLVWGALADRIGNRIVFLLAVGLWAVSTVLLMETHSLIGIAIVFAGLGAGQGGFQNSTQNMILEFGAREDLAMRIAVLNTGTSFASAIGPLIGGFIAGAASYAAVFWISTSMLAIAFAMVFFLVAEPRKRNVFH